MSRKGCDAHAHGGEMAMFRTSRVLVLSGLVGLSTAALCTFPSRANAQLLRRPGLGTKLGERVPATTSAPSAAILPSETPASATQEKGAPDATAADKDVPPAASDGKAQEGPKSAWLTNPPVAVIPRPAFYPMPPMGAGYYSLLDMLTGNYRDKPPAFGYPRFALIPPGFFDSDWRYVDQPGYEPDLLEQLHRIHIGDNWLFATGGEFRYRYNNEVHSRLTANNNHYDLTRVRVFTDLWYKDTFRVYAEFISAESFNQNLVPVLIDRSFADIQNLFVDFKLFEDGYCVPWYVRGGRQELVLGSQRLVSALDWANTRRTFDGVRLFRHGEKFDIDAFWAQVVIPHATRFNRADPQQNFAGLFTEYRPTKTQAFDLFAFLLDNDDVFNFKTRTPAPHGQLPTAPYEVYTFGGRYFGNARRNENILFDFEEMLQLGHSDFSNGSIVAGNTSNGVGYNFSKAPMNPTVWAYWDWASGSRNPLSGQMSTFNQLYPFNHYYFGWLDYVGRSNINDWNFHLYLYPTKWITFNTQFHIFMLDRSTDALYNAGSTILRFDPTGKSGRDVGRELDLIVNFHLTPRQDLLIAYGHLWEGRFLRATGPGTFADTTWLLYNVRW
jgi:hypothetical protein